MIVTISGMVGSGKSTAARDVVTFLESAGVRANYLRFRSLGLFARGRARKSADDPAPRQHPPARPRWTGFRPKPLTFTVACGYMARMLWFRCFGPSITSAECNVLDRYFYDSFVHYECATARERLFVRLLRRLIPAPDLAIVLVASPETLARRRPDYAPEYIAAAWLGYRRLAEQFPELVEIGSDAAEPMRAQLETLLRDRIPALAAAGAMSGHAHRGVS